jgi:hypothetical protein
MRNSEMHAVRSGTSLPCTFLRIAVTQFPREGGIMPDSTHLNAAQVKVCYIVLSLGAAMLAIGLYAGFAGKSSSALIFVLLGTSIALFAVASSLPSIFRKYRFLEPAIATASPEVKTEIKAETKIQPKSDTSFEPKPATKLETKPEAKSESKRGAAPEPGNNSEPGPETNPAFAKLINTRLGDLLLADLLKDPERAGRIVAQAIAQAEGLVADASAGKTKAGPKPVATAGAKHEVKADQKLLKAPAPTDSAKPANVPVSAAESGAK